MTLSRYEPRSAAAQPLSTYELLDAIEKHANDWPVVLSRRGVSLVCDAITRETQAGNLRAGAVLTEHGRRWLINARAQQRARTD